MKKVFLAILLVIIPVVTTAFASETLKVGYIDLQRVLLESEAGKRARADLESLERSKKTIMDEKVKAANKIEEELTKQSSVLSDEARKVKEDELERLQRDLQRLVSDARTELQKKENELTEAILKDIIDVVEMFGESEGYTIIFRSEVVLYTKKDLELTDLLIKRFNESKNKSKEGKKEATKEDSKSKEKK